MIYGVIAKEMEKRPRGRPRAFDRDLALDRALKVFWGQGYEGASIADLTEAMGITAPSLYAAFKSKEALFREVLDRYIQVESAETVRAFAGAETAYEAIRTFLMDAALRFTDPVNPRGCMISTAVLVCAPENRPAAAASAALRAHTLGAFVTRIQGDIDRGELPPSVDATALARLYGAIVQGMSVQAIDGATREELIDLVELALAQWPRFPLLNA